MTPDHLLVKVGACGVARRDVIERRGDMPTIRLPIVQGGFVTSMRDAAMAPASARE